MKTLLTLWMLALCLASNARQLIPFRSEDHKLKVYRMDSVLILADSAYVISGARAQVLNDKLAELHRAYEANARLVDANAVLLNKVTEIERLVVQLIKRMKDDQEGVTLTINDLLTDLDGHIQELQATNTQLDQQNATLKKQLEAMERTIKRLKRALRTYWWRSAVEKVAIGLGGVGIGVLISR